MDKTTLQTYDEYAASYAQDWRDQPPPADMYALLVRYFGQGPTADIGCGAGRDVAWLAENGFDVRGYDGSDSLLSEARAAYPGLRFDRATLPALDGVAQGAFENVLCETVIMHLAPTEIDAATRNLLALLGPGGTLYLSWRVTEGESQRDKLGRLYAAFDRESVLGPIRECAEIVLDEDVISESSGKRIQRLIARKRT